MSGESISSQERIGSQLYAGEAASKTTSSGGMKSFIYRLFGCCAEVVSTSKTSIDLRESVKGKESHPWWSYLPIAGSIRWAYRRYYNNNEKKSDEVEDGHKSGRYTMSIDKSPEDRDSIVSSVRNNSTIRDTSISLTDIVGPNGVRSSVWKKQGYEVQVKCANAGQRESISEIFEVDQRKEKLEEIESSSNSVRGSFESIKSEEKNTVSSSETNNLTIRPSEATINKSSQLKTFYENLNSLFTSLGEVRRKISLTKENDNAFDRNIIAAELLNYQPSNSNDSSEAFLNLKRVALYLQEAYRILNGSYSTQTKEVKKELKLINSQLIDIQKKFFEMNGK